MATTAQRQRALRARRTQAGLVRVHDWAYPSDLPYIKQFIAMRREHTERWSNQAQLKKLESNNDH